jgi:hypothetical protein
VNIPIKKPHVASVMRIRMAMAFYACGEPARHFTKEAWNSEAGSLSRLWLHENGLIDGSGNPTLKLSAYINHLLAQPLPVEKQQFETQGVST